MPAFLLGCWPLHWLHYDHGAVARCGIQVQYSLLDRRAENAMAAFCAECGIRLLPYGTTAGGLLSDKYLGLPASRCAAGGAASDAAIEIRHVHGGGLVSRCACPPALSLNSCGDVSVMALTHPKCSRARARARRLRLAIATRVIGS